MLKTLLARGEPFFIASKAAVRQRLDLWASELSSAGVKPFYAVKCNPDRQLIQMAAEAGWGFDCASPLEVDEVRSVDVQSDIIYANPCKSPAAIRRVDATLRGAASATATTFDSPEELEKLGSDAWRGRLILRLKVDDSGSLQPFGSKFGCPPEDVGEVMRYLKMRHLKLSGISFHVGSNCLGGGSYRKAIETAYDVIGRGSGSGSGSSVFADGTLMIDIGGGFPGCDDDLFKRQADEIRRAMRREIDGRSIMYIAEPGRFLATRPYSLYVPVIAKRVGRGGDGGIQYTLDESIYSSLSGIQFDGMKPAVEVIRSGSGSGSVGPGASNATLFGRTCDSQDIIMKGLLEEMAVGDFVCFKDAGAYTISSSSEFNGFPKTAIHWDQ